MAKQHNRVLWSPAAQQDLIEIWGYLLRVAGADVADRLLHEINRTGDRIASVDPRMHQERSDLMPDLPGGLRCAPVHPYGVFYRITPQNNDERDEVEIIRVLHQQRDLPSILDDDSRP